jgi:hypothetical protein
MVTTWSSVRENHALAAPAFGDVAAAGDLDHLGWHGQDRVLAQQGGQGRDG